MEHETDVSDFTERTGLPQIASEEELRNLGARWFTSEEFEHKGTLSRIEQMQYQGNGGIYVWKRLIPSQGDGQTPYQIHAEFSPERIGHYEYK